MKRPPMINRSTTLFVNGVYDIETNSAFTPYVGTPAAVNRVDSTSC